MNPLSLARLSCFVFLVGATSGAHSQCTRLVLAADPDYPPLHWYDGTNMQGASITIAKRYGGHIKKDRRSAKHFYCIPRLPCSSILLRCSPRGIALSRLMAAQT